MTHLSGCHSLSDVCMLGLAWAESFKPLVTIEFKIPWHIIVSVALLFLCCNTISSTSIADECHEPLQLQIAPRLSLINTVIVCS